MIYLCHHLNWSLVKEGRGEKFPIDYEFGTIKHKERG